MDKENKSFGERLPEWARARRPRVVITPSEKVPELSGGAEKIVDASLREAMQKVEQGDFSGLRASYPQPPIFRPRTPATECAQSHYLEADEDDAGNRLSWWTKTPPATSELSAYLPFDCVFHPLLRQRMSWAGQDTGDSPSDNATPFSFTFLDRPPSSIATIQNMPVTVMTGFDASSRMPGYHSVVVNAVADDFVLEDSQPWPPLTIVFDQCQRAVGIEYGFAGDREISPVGVQLTAYSRSGAELVRSQGGVGGLGSPSPIQPGEVFHQIGVQHRWGEIRYVVLSVSTDRAGEIDPGEPIQTPPLIYRVWHESMPPAAVTQGFTETVWSGGSNVSESHHPIEYLPFRCDQAVVLLRGFRVAFLDGQPRQTTGMEIAFNVQREQGSLRIAPTANSGLQTREEPAPPRMVRLYYTLLAWDSEQVDAKATGFSGGVFGGLGQGRAERESSGVFQFTDLVVPNPCGPIPCSDPPLGAFTGFRVWSGEGNLETMELAQDLDRSFSQVAGQDVVWPVTLAVTDTQADIFFYWWLIHAQILTGGISSTSPHGYGFFFGPPREGNSAGPGVLRRPFHVSDFCGVRPAFGVGRYSPTADEVLNAGLGLPIEADLAFPVLGTWTIEANNRPVREMEVEVHSRRYDGAVLDWQVGRGASLSGPENEDCLFIAAAPMFGQLSRTSRSRGTVEVQHAIFETVPGIVATTPVRFGVVRNLGPGPLLITRAAKGGIDEAQFSIRLGITGSGDPAWQAATFPEFPRRSVFALEDFFAGPPVQLLAGEAMLIGGRFFTEDTGERNAFLEFGINWIPGTVTVQLLGRTIQSNAVAQWIPTRINFGLQPIGRQHLRNALITSDGSTPLVITAIRLEDTQAGFNILSSGGSGVTGVRFQIQPGASYQVPVLFQPQTQGHVTTRVIAETNAGDIVLELHGTGVTPS